VTDPYNCDYVGLASYGVRLSHSVDRGDLFSEPGHTRRFGVDQDEGGDHVPHRTPMRARPAGPELSGEPTRPLCWGYGEDLGFTQAGGSKVLRYEARQVARVNTDRYRAPAEPRPRQPGARRAVP